jgi:hypothetical protein
MLGKYQCANGLRNAGLRIVIHDDIFSQTTEDTEWIGRCALENWVIITGDHWKRGRREAAQIRAVAAGRVRVFQLATSEIPAELWAQAIIKVERKIWKLLKIKTGPFMARIRPGGHVGLLEGYFDTE